MGLGTIYLRIALFVVIMVIQYCLKQKNAYQV